jgi:hypothetical protein
VTVGAFIDVEQALIVWLADKLPDVTIGQKLPQTDPVNFVRVTRSPGNNTAESATPRVDVECFAADRTRMWILAGRVNNAIAELAGDVIEVAVDEDGSSMQAVQVDDVFTITDPVPGYWSPSVERSVAVYEFDVRSEF